MKKEELCETLGDLDPAMVKKRGNISVHEELRGKNGRPLQPVRRSLAELCWGLRHGETVGRVLQSVIRRG